MLPVVHEVCERHSVVVLVDELGRGCDASEDARAFVAGLFQAAVDAASSVIDERCWRRVFATGGGRGLDSFAYMVDRTLFRPREIIQLCTEALERAQARDESLPIARSAIAHAERTYSEERTKDIVAEHRHQYPGLLSILEAFRGGRSHLHRAELEEVCL